MTRMLDAKAVDTPMKLNVKYNKNNEELVLDPSLYRTFVDLFIYLTTTRSDISYAI